MAAANLFGVAAGIIGVHVGFQPMLRLRDRIVSQAQSSVVLRANRGGNPVAAACLDFAGNLFAATATAAAGWWAPAPLPVAVYRGWVGGIVSVDGNHQSRFSTPASGLYYSFVLGLQLIAYILLGGAGMSLGLARIRSEYRSSRLLDVPRQAWRDAALIFVLVVPIFAVASAVEFLWQP